MPHRNDLADVHRAITHHGAGQFAASDVFFDQNLGTIIPFSRADDLRRVSLIFFDDYNTEARTFTDRLDDVRRLHRMLRADFETVEQKRRRNSYTSRSRDLLGAILVHGKR